ncbi:Xylose transport system permease protein XylH [Curvibacter sp. AEP1-3]|jgi:D-xylose transport system permease protein|uniref:sugar ABC transporter permease n=1 Tax=Curvibacter sp. AEP1-3 TaxID=1844971 RepID=UPI000B56E4ED|nr:ABC transporter permease [Curvibacter sp. AEP1-3]ARV17562.1 Xylose transport system permease protein XylH [Curvibacter sp. AEP1-3]
MNQALKNLKHSAIDWRMVLMTAVLVVTTVVFNVLSGGIFFSAENLYNIAQQTAVVGILATVMVLIIVARHIDLSVGSVMGFVGVLIAFLMYTLDWSWPAACLAGLAAAILTAVYQGVLTAYVGVPSFVVTLGGLMSFRGAAYLVADGKTQPLSDPFFLKLGGGFNGGIGTTASWILGGVISLCIVLSMLAKRRSKQRYDVPTNPLGLDIALSLIPIVLVMGFVAVMNAYQIPGKDDAQGVPIPVLIWGAVAVIMAFIVHRTRFGRYVFAMGGNPDAAALVGIPVKRVTMMLFLLLAVLTTIAAIVAISRLNAGTNSLGNNLELLVIAATVIGGTALAGGSGTILGSVLGALIMQCIDSGMLLLDVSIGTRYVIIGQVLIAAVVFDVAYRKWTGDVL